MQLQIFMFSFLATVAVGSALMVILKKNPVASAFSLVLTFFSFAGIYALMGAHFIAALQILVYTGAIMVLFIFVIMLLNADEPIRDFADTGTWTKIWALFSVGIFGFILFRTVSKIREIVPAGTFTEDKVDQAGGNLTAISIKLFSDHVFTFELTSFLLLSAIVSTIALAKRKRTQS